MTDSFCNVVKTMGLRRCRWSAMRPPAPTPFFDTDRRRTQPAATKCDTGTRNKARETCAGASPTGPPMARAGRMPAPIGSGRYFTSTTFAAASPAAVRT